jgi:hypothetical protein
MFCLLKVVLNKKLQLGFIPESAAKGGGRDRKKSYNKNVRLG